MSRAAITEVAAAALRLHPLAEQVPEMRPAEWRAFLEDVRERGILEPLRLASDGVIVLDGRHRLRAAQGLGLAAVPAAPADCPPGGETGYMVRAALHRRHLSDDQRAILAARLAEAMTPERWGRRESGTAVIPLSAAVGRSREIAARELGVSERRLRTAQALAQDAPDLAAEVEAGTKPLLVARAEAQRRAAIAELATAAPPGLPEGAEIWQGDAFELAERIPADSVDLLLTDPPYGAEWLDSWPRLGQLGRRVLKPGGWLTAYIGHMHMPAELEGLTAAGLEWGWMAAITFHGSHPAIRARSARTMFRPIAILRQPGGGEAPWFSDLLTTDPAPQKGLHPWQQSLGPARALIRRFSLPGALVLDPFAGAGTFPLAAAMEGRRALGIERDAAHAEVARQRLAGAGTPKKASA